jgi:hypothetical protein
MSRAAWKPVNPEAATRLSDARRQLHHAVQIASAFGNSYLEKRDDDSQSNLGWVEIDGALASNEVNGTSVAVRVADLTLLIGEQSYEMLGKTITEAADWLRDQLQSTGFDTSRFTLERTYEIPEHPVGNGESFSARSHDLQSLGKWFWNAVPHLEKVRSQNDGASDVRCWPHHFDIATLISLDADKTVGAGMEPGDIYYDQPYFYVNANPPPWGSELPQTLKGHGEWHTQEWLGVVLPASNPTNDITDQEQQVADYFASAVPACRALLREQS